MHTHWSKWDMRNTWRESGHSQVVLSHFTAQLTPTHLNQTCESEFCRTKRVPVQTQRWPPYTCQVVYQSLSSSKYNSDFFLKLPGLIVFYISYLPVLRFQNKPCPYHPSSICSKHSQACLPSPGMSTHSIQVTTFQLCVEQSSLSRHSRTLPPTLFPLTWPCIHTLRDQAAFPHMTWHCTSSLQVPR